MATDEREREMMVKWAKIDSKSLRAAVRKMRGKESAALDGRQYTH